MLRVGIDAWGISDGQLHSGFGSYTNVLLRHLPSAGVKLFVYGAPREARPAWLPNAVVWRTPRSVVGGKFAAIDSRLRQLPAMVDADALDVFHAPAVHVRPSLPPVPLPGCPVVATVHDVIPLNYYRRRLPLRLSLFYGWNLRRALRAQRVVTVSRHSRDEIAAVTGVDPARLTVIPNAVDFTLNADHGPLAEVGISPPYVLFAGSYEPRKNLAGALSAFALLSRRVPHQLVAVVERSSGHAPAAHALIDRLGLWPRVRLVDSLAELSLRAVYTHADVLLFTSLAEGFGFPPLQAAACSVPVVASRLGVIEETMGDAAVLVDGSDPEEVCEATYRVLLDPDLRRRLVANGLARVANFSVEPFITHHVRVYEEAASTA